MRCRKVSLFGDVKTRPKNRREVDPMEVATSDIGVDRGILAAVVQVAQERRAMLLAIRDAIDSGDKDEVLKLAARLVGRDSQS